MSDQSQSHPPASSSSGAVSSAGSTLPFETEGVQNAAVISSLDGRLELVETARSLLIDLAEHAGPSQSPASQPRTSQARSSKPSTSAADAGAPTPAEAAGAQPHLVIQAPGGTMETRRAIDSPRFLVGRDNCDLELSDRFVERWHVQLFERDGNLVLQDLGTDNGVYLRIADDLALEDGDQVVAGDQRFEFRRSWDTSGSADDAGVAALGAEWDGEPVRLIRLIEGDRVGGVYPLAERLTVGTGSADVCFPEDAKLSAPHVGIRRQHDKYILRDLDSQFGTFIRIADAVELIEGDCFMVGRTRIRLMFP